MPWQIGDGRIDGNGDLTLGWHWRLWNEDGMLPAFALRNYVRLPSGVDSAGVDYILRGLATWTVIDNSMRFHLNPYLKSLNGNNYGDEARHFLWGTAPGIDYKLTDDLLFITDYIYGAGKEEHTRDDHRAEFGLDWNIDEHQKLGLALKSAWTATRTERTQRSRQLHAQLRRLIRRFDSVLDPSRDRRAARFPVAFFPLSSQRRNQHANCAAQHGSQDLAALSATCRAEGRNWRLVRRCCGERSAVILGNA